MSHSRQREKWMIYLLAVLLCLVLASFWVMCNIYAKYTASADGSDSARVAAFVFEVSSKAESDSIPVENIKKPGDKAVYNITVTNKNASGKVSEVTESYTIEASMNGSIPLSCTIKNSEGNELISIMNGTGKASYQKDFSDAGEYADQYLLEVEWPAEEKDAVYANGSGQAEVEITITGVQKD